MAIHIDLTGHTAWVTGGASGIGEAIVSKLAEAGARVVSIDRAYADAGPAAGSGGRASADTVAVSRVPLNLADPKAIQAAANRLLDTGFEPDILVNNAGITRDAPVWKLGDDDWADVLNVNLSGAFHLIRAVVPALRDRRRGAIVNIASINGLRGKFGQVNYGASKGGLIALTRALARELGGRGIRVNAIAPGMVGTPMTDTLAAEVRETAKRETALGHIGRPEDIANAAVFLASPLAAHITGHVLVVDGGQIA